MERFFSLVQKYMLIVKIQRALNKEIKKYNKGEVIHIMFMINYL